MSQNVNFKGDKTLRWFTIITMLYSGLMIIKYAGNLLGFIFKLNNPLIPKYLTHYVAFPVYFILPFFVIIIFLCIWALKINSYNYKVVYTLFGLVLFFFLFQWVIYEFLVKINPYGS